MFNQDHMPLCEKHYGILLIMNSLLYLKEGAFAERLTDKAITRVIAQESKDDELKFFVFAINADTKTAYVMRHGRTNELRTWRLDNLAKFLKLHSVENFEVQYVR
ncbi:hypothetical protein [Paraglaciecola chathamensis]|uniref:Uncharacterized protein n=1 Tax=Paraglaciecola chathamensis TaxID=368405 RepID=A0A8H9IJV2_9ALTE|nr:hypothetical protein [Paraglaciecola oceanifecundans]GGZ83068.1 hypothetical protein GCM10011274_45860 [Paraglaciecola oceanifecundans]